MTLKMMLIQTKNLMNESESKVLDFWSWFAGFIDGEGCFIIQKLIKPKNCRGDSYTFKLAIGLAGKGQREILINIRNYIGRGTVNNQPLSKNNKSERTVIIFSGDNLRYIIKMIMPYLIVKKHDAEIVEKALSLSKANNGSFNGSKLWYRPKMDELILELRKDRTKGRRNAISNDETGKQLF